MPLLFLLPISAVSAWPFLRAQLNNGHMKSIAINISYTNWSAFYLRWSQRAFAVWRRGTESVWGDCWKQLLHIQTTVPPASSAPAPFKSSLSSRKRQGLLSICIENAWISTPVTSCCAGGLGSSHFWVTEPIILSLLHRQQERGHYRLMLQCLFVCLLFCLFVSWKCAQKHIA